MGCNWVWCFAEGITVFFEFSGSFSAVRVGECYIRDPVPLGQALFTGNH